MLRIWVISIILLLTGCARQEGIEVEFSGDGTSFAVTGESGKLACIDRISVGVKQGHDVFLSWSLTMPYENKMGRRENCRSSFRYGHAEQGYYMRYQGARLEPGKTYYVTASERGWSVGKSFTVPR